MAERCSWQRGRGGHGGTAVGCALLLGCALACAPGCSVVFVAGPPANHAELPHVECTTSRALPILDTVVAGAYGLASASAAADRAPGGPSSAYRSVPMLAMAAAVGASAAHGYATTTDCRAARRQWKARLAAPAPNACGRDVDCAGDRVCEASLCVDPILMLPPPFAAPPAAPEAI